jgi:hypothetical protein
MLVPITTVDKNRFPAADEGQVRVSRKILPVESKPVAKCMRRSAHDELGLHVFASNCSHVCAAAFG